MDKVTISFISDIKDDILNYKTVFRILYNYYNEKIKLGDIFLMSSYQKNICYLCYNNNKTYLY